MLWVIFSSGAGVVLYGSVGGQCAPSESSHIGQEWESSLFTFPI